MAFNLTVLIWNLAIYSTVVTLTCVVKVHINSDLEAIDYIIKIRQHMRITKWLLHKRIIYYIILSETSKIQLQEKITNEYHS